MTYLFACFLQVIGTFALCYCIATGLGWLLRATGRPLKRPPAPTLTAVPADLNEIIARGRAVAPLINMVAETFKMTQAADAPTVESIALARRYKRLEARLRFYKRCREALISVQSAIRRYFRLASH